MGGVVTKEKSINPAQYLELVYSQYGNLYELIPHAPRPSNDPSKPPFEPPMDGVVGSIQTKSTMKSTKQHSFSSPKTTSTPTVSTKENVAQSLQ